MRYLLLFLVCFNVNAEIFKLEINRNDGFKGSKQVTDATYNKYIKKLIKHPKYKGEWVEEISGSITAKVVGEKTWYYKPTNFTLTKTDITQEVEDKKNKIKNRKNRLKAVLNDPNTSQVIKDIIRTVVSE